MCCPYYCKFTKFHSWYFCVLIVHRFFIFKFWTRKCIKLPLFCIVLYIFIFFIFIFPLPTKIKWQWKIVDLWYANYIIFTWWKTWASCIDEFEVMKFIYIAIIIRYVPLTVSITSPVKWGHLVSGVHIWWSHALYVATKLIPQLWETTKIMDEECRPAKDTINSNYIKISCGEHTHRFRFNCKASWKKKTLTAKTFKIAPIISLSLHVLCLHQSPHIV